MWSQSLDIFNPYDATIESLLGKDVDCVRKDIPQENESK